jgi:ferredoxin
VATSIEIVVDGIPLRVPSGETLAALASEERMPVVFGCYSARCGICRVRVLEGAENLGPRNEMEESLLGPDRGPEDRLACQCRVHGPASFRSAGP